MVKTNIYSIFVLPILTYIIQEIYTFTPLTMNFSEIIHENAELGKVVLNADGSNTILSKEYNKKGSTFISKIDNRGNFVYHNSKFKSGYSKEAQIMEAKTNKGNNTYIFYYKTKEKEFFTEFKDKGVDQMKKEKALNSYHVQISTFI